MRRLFDLPRNVVRLGWVSFFTDAGSELILPLLPMFLRSTLRAPMWAIGLIEGAAEGMANVMRLASGYFSDRAGKTKIFVLLGYGLSTLAKPVLAVAPNWAFVLGVRLTDRVGKGIRAAPRDSLLAASTPKEITGRAYGFHRSMDTAGALVGSGMAALALFFVGAPGVRWLFAASLVPSAAALLFLWRVKEPKPSGQAGPVRAARPLVLPRSAWILLAGVALWEMGNLSYAFVLLRLSDLGVPAKFIPVLYFAYNVLYMLTAMPAGMAADRLGIRTALILSPLVGAGTFLALSLDVSWLAVPLGLALFAAHSAVVNTIPRAAVAHYAPPGAKGTLFGLTGGAAFAGNFLGGALWEFIGPVRALQTASVLTLLALLPFLALSSGHKAHEEAG